MISGSSAISTHRCSEFGSKAADRTWSKEVTGSWAAARPRTAARCRQSAGASGCGRGSAVGAGSDQLGYVEVGERQVELGYFHYFQPGFGGAPRPQPLGLFPGSFQRRAAVERDTRYCQPGLAVEQ
jgi:hypothetical protein